MAVADTTEHPGDLLDRAAELEQEADELRAQAEHCTAGAKEREARAAALRHKAKRILNPELGVTVKRRPARAPDSLLSAAAIAVEEIPGTFFPTDLARRLQIGSERAERLLEALLELGQVDRVSGGFRAFDPQAKRVRDKVIELGEFTKAELAMALEVHPSTLSWYLADLRQRGIVEGSDAQLRYVKTGPERMVTRRRSAPTPEDELRGKVIERGGVVAGTGQPMVESGGNRRRAGQRKARGGTVRQKKS